MRFTAQEEYGLRCMLQFARQGIGAAPRGGESGSEERGRSLTIGEIAQIEGLTPEYAGKLVRILRMGGLLASVRGRHGGYRVARPVEEISVGEVLAVLGGRVFEPDYCLRYTGERKLCVHSVDCAIRSLWGALQGMVESVLSRIKLKDLLGTEERVSLWLGSLTGQPAGDTLLRSVPVEVSAAISEASLKLDLGASAPVPGDWTPLPVSQPGAETMVGDDGK